MTALPLLIDSHTLFPSQFLQQSAFPGTSNAHRMLHQNLKSSSSSPPACSNNSNSSKPKAVLVGCITQRKLFLRELAAVVLVITTTAFYPGLPSSASHPSSNFTFSKQNQSQPSNDTDANAQVAPSCFPAFELNAANANNRMESATPTFASSCGPY